MENFYAWEKELKEGIDYVYDSCGLKIHPNELKSEYRDIIEKVGWEADQTVIAKNFHVFDAVELQKKILKERYGIEWKHCYELNPELVKAALM